MKERREAQMLVATSLTVLMLLLLSRSTPVVSTCSECRSLDEED